ncbi:response regulator [Maribellus maritimus]|uniref:response regulator n=1 Tax=Maribellus maritimus TaxID=2870838 RepID=UPI001EEC069E|nr:response regulator transcription factor [Maribellus maritimus]
MKKINIYLVDDHSLFREGLRFLLSNLNFVNEVFEAENGKQFIAGLKGRQVNVALLDIEMPEMNGMDAARKALEINPEIKIVALSMYSDESYYSSMIEAGANGFLLKNSNFSEVKKAIVDICEGRNYFSIEILQSIVNRINKKTTKPENNELTEREIDVLYQICKGRSNPEIAEILSISKRTVDKHRENLLQKTNSKNTANLVVYAIKQGYFEV